MNYDPNQDFLPLDDILPVVDRTRNGRQNAIDVADIAIDDQTTTNIFEHRRSSILLSSNISATRLSLGAFTETNQTINTSLARSSYGNGNNAAHLPIIGSSDGCSCLRLVQGGSDISNNGILVIPGTTPVCTQQYDDIDQIPCDSHSNEEMVDSHRIDFGEFDDDNDGVGFQLDKKLGAGNKVTFDLNEPAERTENRRCVETGSTPLKSRLDFWRNLDPHSVDSFKPKPLCVGKTINLPPELNDRPSDRATGSITHRILQSDIASVLVTSVRSSALASFEATITRKRRIAEGIEYGNQDESSRKEDNPFCIPLKGLVFGKEFAYIAAAIAKRKSAERRMHRKLLRATEHNGDTSNGHFKDVLEVVQENCDNDYDDDGGGFELYENVECIAENDTYDGYSPRVTETNTGLVSIDAVFGSSSEYCKFAQNRTSDLCITCT
jgi:Condensin II complex subunit CAP-H2 or CNDH2, C-term